MNTDLPVNQVVCGDCIVVLPAWPAGSVHMVVTSVPYWGLRDYGIAPSVWGGSPVLWPKGI